MACNPNLKRIQVDLQGNWRIHQPEGPSGYEMLGVVSRGSELPGALARIKTTGEYVQLNNGVETALLQSNTKKLKQKDTYNV